MYDKPIGVSILTNGQRLSDLQLCIDSLLAFCHYRPLSIGIFNNGSTDGTYDWLNDCLLNQAMPYGVTIRVQSSMKDIGCASGTNFACEMVKDCEYQLHLESDFKHLSPEESGVDRLWLRHAVEFMQKMEANYMYLRRMTCEQEMMVHWWSQWMTKIRDNFGPYLDCPEFWWSNNPALFNNKALYKGGTLPLDQMKDGPKGSNGWSQPELTARPPGRAWIHQWGMFVHEYRQQAPFKKFGCGTATCFGLSTCKYGFLREHGSAFCDTCKKESGYNDMQGHEDRFRRAIGMR